MSAARVPRASIIVPSFDHGPFVLGAVRSVLDQTEPDVEVLVIDDGSTDDSLARLATVDDPRMTVLRHPNRCLS
ncbi:MAG: glycosyltransferase family 2 protein, partial [Alphaproteobacteria bacterium]